MKIVITTDEAGYKHRYLVTDEMDEDAAHQGMPQDPPDISKLPWDAIKRDLHNALVDRGLVGYDDILGPQDGVTGAIKFALRGELIKLYKERRGIRR
jgi:hypothetical protein